MKFTPANDKRKDTIPLWQWVEANTNKGLPVFKYVNTPDSTLGGKRRILHYIPGNSDYRLLDKNLNQKNKVSSDQPVILSTSTDMSIQTTDATLFLVGFIDLSDEVS